MKNIIFDKIKENDISELTKISIEAFHSDYTVGAPNKEGGPPGYNSCQFYNKMMKVSKAFYKIVIDNQIIGGFFIFDIFDGSHSHCELGRIFIDPKYQHKGYGIEAMNFLFDTYKNVKKWSLGTPSWNTRTRNFYKKCGFKISKEDDKEVLFEKSN